MVRAILRRHASPSPGNPPAAAANTAPDLFPTDKSIRSPLCVSAFGVGLKVRHADGYRSRPRNRGHGESSRTLRPSQPAIATIPLLSGGVPFGADRDPGPNGFFRIQSMRSAAFTWGPTAEPIHNLRPFPCQRPFVRRSELLLAQNDFIDYPSNVYSIQSPSRLIVCLN
jgi:hypothetical protein